MKKNKLKKWEWELDFEFEERKKRIEKRIKKINRRIEKKKKMFCPYCNTRITENLICKICGLINEDDYIMGGDLILEI